MEEIVEEEKLSKAEFIKMIIDQFTDEEKKEFSILISRDIEVKNKIELQVG